MEAFRGSEALWPPFLLWSRVWVWLSLQAEQLARDLPMLDHPGEQPLAPFAPQRALGVTGVPGRSPTVHKGAFSPRPGYAVLSA